MGLLEVTLGSGGEDKACPREVSDGNLGPDLLVLEYLKMPAFLRVMTSSTVYSSRSPAVPQNSVSLLVKGPIVMCGYTPLTIRETETLTSNGLYI